MQNQLTLLHGMEDLQKSWRKVSSTHNLQVPYPAAVPKSSVCKCLCDAAPQPSRYLPLQDLLASDEEFPPVSFSWMLLVTGWVHTILLWRVQSSAVAPGPCLGASASSNGPTAVQVPLKGVLETWVPILV